jgi:hypothetical protein
MAKPNSSSWNLPSLPVAAYYPGHASFQDRGDSIPSVYYYATESGFTAIRYRRVLQGKPGQGQFFQQTSVLSDFEIADCLGQPSPLGLRVSKDALAYANFIVCLVFDGPRKLVNVQSFLSLFPKNYFDLHLDPKGTTELDGQGGHFETFDAPGQQPLPDDFPYETRPEKCLLRSLAKANTWGLYLLTSDQLYIRYERFHDYFFGPKGPEHQRSLKDALVPFAPYFRPEVKAEFDAWVPISDLLQIWIDVNEPFVH